MSAAPDSGTSAVQIATMQQEHPDLGGLLSTVFEEDLVAWLLDAAATLQKNTDGCRGKY